MGSTVISPPRSRNEGVDAESGSELSSHPSLARQSEVGRRKRLLRNIGLDLRISGDRKMIRKAIARLHRDEQGIEALQAVLVMAIAAVVLAVVKAKWPSIKNFFNSGVD